MAYDEDVIELQQEAVAYRARLATAENEIARLTAERDRLHAWLETIERLTDDEVRVRFRTSSHKTEDQMAKGSVIYTMLSMPRNLARAALRGDAIEQNGQTK